MALTDHGRDSTVRATSILTSCCCRSETSSTTRTRRVRSLRTDAFVERINWTLLDECFRVTGCTTWYEQVGQIQATLERFLAYYALDRNHQGYRQRGRTPAQALREALGRDELPSLNYQLPQEDTTNQTEAA